MSEPFQDYLRLLREVRSVLQRLSPLAQQKAAAVKENDLLGLDEVLKQEQALGLSLRGLELRRQKLVSQLGLDGVPLSELPGKCPPELAEQAEKIVRDLQRSYRDYRNYADMARTTLELNLHRIEKLVIAAGGSPKDFEAGYAPASMEPPKRMKTDFRA